MLIMVLLMATGTTDPVRRATVKGWDQILPALTTPGSDPDGSGGTYCEHQTVGSHCSGDGGYYEQSTLAVTSTNVDTACQFGVGFSQMEALQNCTVLSDLPAGASGLNDGCSTYENLCVSCAMSCMEAQIQDVKDNLIPASYMSLGLMLYFVITVVWNNTMISTIDTEGLEGTPKIIGLVLNGVLAFLAFVMIMMGSLGYTKAADACTGAAESCVPDSMVWLILTGVATMVVAIIVIAGIMLQNIMLIKVPTLLMILLSILMVLFSIFLGMSTGVVMDDATYYYDTQYPKLRSAYEKLDHTYCQHTKEDCLALLSGTAAPVLSEGTQITCEAGDDTCITEMSYDDVRQHMHAAAAVEAKKEGAPQWLVDGCDTTTICIYCGPMYDQIGPAGGAGAGPDATDGSYANTQVMQLIWDNTAATVSDRGTPCDGDDYASDPSCVILAPNFDWRDGLVGVKDGTVVGSPTCTGTATNTTFTCDLDGSTPSGVDGDDAACSEGCTSGTSAAVTDCGNFAIAFAPDSSQDTNTGCSATWERDVPNSENSLGVMSKLGKGTNALGEIGWAQRCMAEVVVTEADHYEISNAGESLEHNPKCIGPFSVDSDNALYNKRCVGQYVKQDTVGIVNGVATDNALTGAVAAMSANAGNPCTGLPTELVTITSSDVWTTMIENYTRFNLVVRHAMPYCEEAIQDFALDSEESCKDYEQMTTEQKDSYYSNCDNCRNPFAPFTFNIQGPEIGYRQCLNFFTGYYADFCSDFDSNTCTTAIEANPNYMVDKAISGDSKFCGYSDAGCKAKIKFEIEGDLTTVGVVMCIFLFFFLGVIYCTLLAIETGMNEALGIDGEEDSSEEEEDSDEEHFAQAADE